MSTHSLSSPSADSTTVMKYIFAGLCASLVSIGLARFAYTPLLPALIQAHWFSASDAAYLGAANLAGYLIGAMLGRPIANRLSNEHTLRLMMILVTAAFFGCAFPVSLTWFFAWRLISGISGGAIMVLVAATVLPHVPPQRKHLASGAIFLGIGLGIAASGTLVPLFLNMGLCNAWIGLGLVSAVFTVASWFAWPSVTGISMRGKPERVESSSVHFGRSIYILYTQYALIAIGIVPAVIFLVDFIARGLGAGAHMGSLFWGLYGLGAIVGPPLYGYFADRIGPRLTLSIVLLVEILATLVLYHATDLAVIAVVTFIIGTLPPGIVPLVLALIHELIPHDAHKQNIVWSRSTTVFATFQAIAGYAYSALFAATNGDHRILFLIGGIALALAFAFEAFARLRVGNRQSVLSIECE